MVVVKRNGRADSMTLDHRIDTNIWIHNPCIVEEQSIVSIHGYHFTGKASGNHCPIRKMHQIVEHQRHRDGMGEDEIR